MFSLAEVTGQKSLLNKGGTVEINTDYHAVRKPAWFVLIKMLGVIAMVAVGAAIALPTLLEYKFPLWQAIVVTAGGMLIYTGIAFFIRPEPNTDNLSSDYINRFLWKLHCVLGPGRFTAGTLLDLCVLLGLGQTDQDDGQLAAETSGALAASATSGSLFDATRPIPALDPNRFSKSPANFTAGQIALDSQRFFQSASPPTSAG